MKSSFATTAIAACTILFSACGMRAVTGSGPVKSEPVQLPAGAFDKIEISAPVDARITVGGAPALTFEGYANIITLLRSKVTAHTLRIYLDEGTGLSSSKPIRAMISLPALSGLEVSGAGNAQVSNTVSAQDFALSLSGSAVAGFAELKVQSFKATLSGSTELTLGSGAINSGSFELSGACNIRAFGVTQQSASFELSGAGMAEATITGKLDASISGSGAISYKGHPAITKDLSGVGSVTDAN